MARTTSFALAAHLISSNVTSGMQNSFSKTPPPKHSIPPWILIEAWNEWGEGSYIEPHQEFGFGYLDAVREVFTTAPRSHLDPVPADVNLGPYDVPPLPPARTAWDFEDSNHGWAHTMNLTDPHLQNGILPARTTGDDPAFFGPPIQTRTTQFSTIAIRMKLCHPNSRTFQDRAQLFWRTRRFPESEATSKRFNVEVDGQWHEYRLLTRPNPRWRGVITRLRLDPVNRPGIGVELDSIRLLP